MKGALVVHVDTIKPGNVYILNVIHDDECKYPQGGQPCTCVNGPEEELIGFDPKMA
jgi:hypothetical protein